MFITLEGIDRSGKSTQAKLLAAELGPETLLLREPGGTKLGERVRELVKDPALDVDPMAELLLFCAARAELVAEVIRPALDDGRTVVCDRFSDSSVAYQGRARGLGDEIVREACALATGGLEPDLTLLLKLDPEVAAGREGANDRFEEEGLELQRAVAAGYDAIVRENPGRVVAIDGSGQQGQVHERVMATVRSRVAP